MMVNVGKYTIHGWYGICKGIRWWFVLTVVVSDSSSVNVDGNVFKIILLKQLSLVTSSNERGMIQGFIVSTPFDLPIACIVTLRISAKDTIWFHQTQGDFPNRVTKPCSSATYVQKQCFFWNRMQPSESPNTWENQGKLKQLLVEAISTASECSVPR